MQISTAEKILNAAEELFSQSRYDAVSIRQITSKAGVRLALAHYHFGTKEALFNAVIERRIGQLSQSRLRLLEHLLQENDGRPLQLEQIVHAFVMPYLFWHLTGGKGWRNYARIVSTLLGDNLALLQDQFDGGARVFQREMRRSMPGADESSVQWGFDFMVGVMCNTFSEVDRISGLSNGRYTIENKEEACSYLIAFIVSGLERLANNQKQDVSGSLDLMKSLTVPESVS